MSLHGLFSLSHKGEMSHWPNKNTINFSETWNIFKIIYFLKATLIENSSESLRILNMLSFGQYLVNYKFLLFFNKNNEWANYCLLSLTKFLLCKASTGYLWQRWLALHQYFLYYCTNVCRGHKIFQVKKILLLPELTIKKHVEITGDI